MTGKKFQTDKGTIRVTGLVKINKSKILKPHLTTLQFHTPREQASLVSNAVKHMAFLLG